MILNDFKLIIWAKTVEIISKLSRRDTIIDNCQLSIVNCQFGEAAKRSFILHFQAATESLLDLNTVFNKSGSLVSGPLFCAFGKFFLRFVKKSGMLGGTHDARSQRCP